MIEYKTGDLLAEQAEALVNTVNCVGVMGRGVALQFKNAFPENFKAYERECRQRKMEPGRMFVVELKRTADPRYIINFPTKRHWRGKSRMADIEAGLQALTKEILSRGIRSVALPPLGSGLGGLDWQEVRKRIQAVLENLTEVKITVFEPSGGGTYRVGSRSGDIPDMTPGRATLVVLMDHYLQGLLDPFVTLLEVHKLMYFMQEAGENLELKFSKALYGPYAENLRHVLKQIEGHFISGYADGGDAPHKELAVVPGTLQDARDLLDRCPETRRRLERVERLVTGYESDSALELLATVHWVMNREGARTITEVVLKTYDWNNKKKRFTEPQIERAARRLSEQGWLEELVA